MGWRRDLYLDYMLLGLYPAGPFDSSPAGADNTRKMSFLINCLANSGQFTALNELIQRCEPLAIVPVNLSLFSSHQLTRFLARVSIHQPALAALEISGLRHEEDQREIEARASALADFISRSTCLKAFNFFLLSSEYSLLVIGAIVNASYLETLHIGYGAEFSGEACDKLQGVIRNSERLKAVSLSSVQVSEEQMLEILRALRSCSQPESITLDQWNFSNLENLTELSQLIEKSTSLKHLTFTQNGRHLEDGHCPAMDAIAAGLSENTSLHSVSVMIAQGSKIKIDHLLGVIEAAKRHPCIRQLSLHDQHRYLLPVTRALAGLVEKNKGIVDVDIDSAKLGERYLRFFDEVMENWQKKNPGDHGQIPQSTDEMLFEMEKLCVLIEEKTARNKAIASGDLAKIFSNAFFPSPGAPWGSNHISEPGLPLTEEILSFSPNLPNFFNTMVEVALSIDETAKLEQAQAEDTRHNETTNDQTIELRHTTRDDAKPNANS